MKSKCVPFSSRSLEMQSTRFDNEISLSFISSLPRFFTISSIVSKFAHRLRGKKNTHCSTIFCDLGKKSRVFLLWVLQFSSISMSSFNLSSSFKTTILWFWKLEPLYLNVYNHRRWVLYMIYIYDLQAPFVLLVYKTNNIWQTRFRN